MTGPIGNFFGEQPEGLHAAPVRATAYYALQPPAAGIGPDTKALVVLHGWGQNARSFIRKFAPLREWDVLVIAPQAPHQFYLDMETRKVGFGWMTAFDRDRSIANVVTLLDTVLHDVEIEHGAGSPCPFVLGFSQGVSIAWRYAVHGDRAVAGVIACGGDLPPDVEQALPGRDSLPVMLVHGRDDSIVPLSKGEAAKKVLGDLKFTVKSDFFDGGHDLPPGLVTRLPMWMDEVLRRAKVPPPPGPI